MKQALFIIFIWVISTSCEKSEKTTLNVDVAINEVFCYPNDSVLIDFSIIVDGGTAPYEFDWKNPSDYIGGGPFKLNLKDNLLIELSVADAKNEVANFNYLIRKDTIDSLKYDYRDIVTGKYIGIHYFIDVSMDSNNQYTILDTTYWNDTILILKDTEYNNLEITGWRENYIVKYDYKNLKFGFSNYTYGNFFDSDSIFIHYYGGQAPPWDEFRGRKEIE